MVDARFFNNHGPFSLEFLAEHTGALLVHPKLAAKQMADVAPLDRASSNDVSFFDNAKYLEQFTGSEAGACFVREKFRERAPASMALLITDDPYRCYALAAQKFYPAHHVVAGTHPTAQIDSSAKIGKGVAIGAGAVIGKRVEVGDGSSIGANTVLYDGVKIGNNTVIGALCSLSHTVIGNDVIIHRGVHIGQDGFGFALGREGHVKVPQLGRVVIEDNVEIGSGTCIDRGTGPDTHIGEGAKIDNLVQIGHNVQIGRRAVVIAQTGISGSTRIGDGAVLAGQVGIAGHLKIGPGVKLAAKSGVMNDIPAGEAWGGSPAVPIKDWHRQTIALSRLIKPKRGSDDGDHH